MAGKELVPKRRRNPNISQEDAESRLIAATLTLLRQRPVREVTSRDIASEAGLNIAHIARYFLSKDALFARVIEVLSDEIDSTISQQSPFEILETLTSAPDTLLHTHLRGYLQYANPDLVIQMDLDKRWTKMTETISQRQNVSMETARIYVGKIRLLTLSQNYFGETTGLSPEQIEKIAQLAFTELGQASANEKLLGWNVIK